MRVEYLSGVSQKWDFLVEFVISLIAYNSTWFYQPNTETLRQAPLVTMKTNWFDSKRILQWSVAIGFVLGLISLTSVGNYVEEEWGLKVLFLLRGARPAPQEVVLVSLDRNTANRFDLPDEPEKWPRTIYADLIAMLTRADAAVIAIDVLFSEPRNPAEDDLLARAIADSGRVVLVSDMKRDTVPIDSDAGLLIGTITVDSVVPPQLRFAEHALGVAPFPIPKNLSLARQFWLYTDNNPHLVTFPTMVLNAYFARMASPELRDWLRQRRPDFAEHLADLEAERMDDNRLHGLVAAVADGLSGAGSLTQPGELEPRQRRLFKGWLSSFRLGAEAHFNHYGPPGSLPTISASRLLGAGNPPKLDFKDKVVFIGYSEDLQPDRNHGFFTYFSDSPEAAVSSAELAAVAFGNLLDQSVIRPIPRFAQALMVLGWSVVAGLWVRRRMSLWLVVTLIAFCAAYFVAAYRAFSDHSLWLPYVIPLWLESPIILLLAGTLQYLTTRRERQQIYSAFRHYIPESVVNRFLAEGVGPQASQGIAIGSGLCLSTDAGQYTKIAEAMDPMALADLMNRYYGVVFPKVTAAGGFISDVVGDAVLALWIGEQGTARECQAVCRSALAIRQAVEAFGKENGLNMPIRIGINDGPFRLGNVGTADRLEYRATGDTVNTASRIENLCKRLGVGILVADGVIHQTEGLLTRRMGEFLLEGKSRSVVVHELLGDLDTDQAALKPLCARFEEGEGLYRAGRLEEAGAVFESILDRFPDDGPSLFYQQQIRNMMDLPRASWSIRVIAVGKQ